MVIQENYVPQLHQILDIALKHKRGLQYILCNIINAVGGKFKLHHSKYDTKLAFLIVKYRGTVLIDIGHRAIGFPSSSTCYRMLRKSTPLISAVDTNIKDFIANFKPKVNCPKYSYMLKNYKTY